MVQRVTRDRIPGDSPDPLSLAGLNWLLHVAGSGLDTAGRQFGCGGLDLTRGEVAVLTDELLAKGYGPIPEPPLEVYAAAVEAHDAGHPELRVYLASWLHRAGGHLRQGLTREQAAAAATEVVIATAHDYCEMMAARHQAAAA